MQMGDRPLSKTYEPALAIMGLSEHMNLAALKFNSATYTRKYTAALDLRFSHVSLRANGIYISGV